MHRRRVSGADVSRFYKWKKFFSRRSRVGGRGGGEVSDGLRDGWASLMRNWVY